MLYTQIVLEFTKKKQFYILSGINQVTEAVKDDAVKHPWVKLRIIKWCMLEVD